MDVSTLIIVNGLEWLQCVIFYESFKVNCYEIWRPEKNLYLREM